MRVERWKDYKHEKKVLKGVSQGYVGSAPFGSHMDTSGSRPFLAMKEGMGKNMESNDVCGSSISLLAE